MIHRMIRFSTVAALAVILTACAGHSPIMTASIATPLDDTGLEPKIDGFRVVLDASQSMDASYRKESRFSFATSLIRQMNATIPAGVGLMAGMRSFGNGVQTSRSNVRVYGMTGYERQKLAVAVDGLAHAGGNSPLADSLAAAGEDMADQSGRWALIGPSPPTARRKDGPKTGGLNSNPFDSITQASQRPPARHTLTGGSIEIPSQRTSTGTGGPNYGIDRYLE